jgi:hypothetical protein
MPHFDTHRQAIDSFLAMQHAGHLPPIDFSNLRQGVVEPVTWSGGGPAAPTRADFEADLRRQMLEEKP